jgi:hypothetical protein
MKHRSLPCGRRSRPAIGRLIPIAALVLHLAWAPDGRAQDAQPIGYVKNVTGYVALLRADRAAKLEPGTPLFREDVIESGEDGAFGITMKDDTRLSGGPNTTVRLKEFVFEPAQGRLQSIVGVLKGTLFYISGTISKLSSEAAKIETPLGLIAVRGTRFAVRIGEEQP